MLEKPSEQEIEQYLLDMDSDFFKILADIEELPAFSVFSARRVTQKLYLILHAVERMVKDSEDTLGLMKVCVEAMNDCNTYDKVKKYIHDYCVKHSNDVAIPSSSLSEQHFVNQAEPEKALVVHGTTSSRFFAASSSSKNEDPEETYTTVLTLAYELCGPEIVDPLVCLKTESNTQELITIFNLMIWRKQGFLDEKTYDAQVDGLVAALFLKTKNVVQHQDLFKSLAPQHWFIPFAVLLFSIAMIPIVLAILEHISPQNQDRFQP